MIQKHIMAPKRKTATTANQHEAEKKVGRKVRRVVIDSDSEDEEEQKTLRKPKELHVQNGTAALVNGEAKTDIVDGDDDEVVAEFDVFMLPSGADDNAGGSGINRLQFPQQHQTWLSRLFDDKQIGAAKWQAQYKTQVRHLKLRFGEPEQHQPMDIVDGRQKMSANSGGIADLLRASSSSSTSLQGPESSGQSSSSGTKVGKGVAEVFTGEGFSQHGMFSHTVGFFKHGKLFLLPIDKTYEMRKPLAGSSERENTKAPATQKASTALGAFRGGLAPTGVVTSSSSGSQSNNSSSNLLPLRIRFARPENELQRRRREQSAFYKQKLVEQDQWLPLRVQQSKVTELYKHEIGHLVEASDSMAAANTGEEEEGNNSVGKPLSLKDLLI